MRDIPNRPYFPSLIKSVRIKAGKIKAGKVIQLGVMTARGPLSRFRIPEGSQDAVALKAYCPDILQKPYGMKVEALI